MSEPWVDFVVKVVLEEAAAGDVKSRIANRLHGSGLSSNEFVALTGNYSPGRKVNIPEPIQVAIGNAMRDIEQGFVEQKGVPAAYVLADHLPRKKGRKTS